MNIPWSEIAEKSIQHLGLTTVALLIAVLVAVPIGIIITQNKKLANPVMAVVNGIQTIPSLALLGFMIPLIGIGTFPAIVALFLYALLPIVRNTYTGIMEVDPSVKEAALGMGMKQSQLLLKIELPLALPVIFSGIRTAFVINIGVATLCSLIGAGGLGDFIFRGISLNNSELILAGAIPAALMALVFDGLMGLLLKVKDMKTWKWIIPGIIFFFLVLSWISFKPSFKTENKLKAGFASEFIYREDGYVGLKEEYNLDLQVIEMDVALSYEALKEKEVDVISAFSTDGRIKAFGFKVLKDDRNFFPPYNAAPLVRNETLQNHPELVQVLGKLNNTLNDSIMTELNFRADYHKETPRAIATDFLSSIGIETKKYTTSGKDLVIGSKNFTESFILAEMFKILIENSTELEVELKPAFGGTKLIFDALQYGEIDLYPEYSGTGYLVLLPEEEQSLDSYDKELIYNYVKERFDQMYDLKWLPPLGFNNTHAIAVRKEMAIQNNLVTIGDLSNLSEP